MYSTACTTPPRHSRRACGFVRRHVPAAAIPAVGGARSCVGELMLSISTDADANADADANHYRIPFYLLLIVIFIVIIKWYKYLNI